MPAGLGSGGGFLWAAMLGCRMGVPGGLGRAGYRGVCPCAGYLVLWLPARGAGGLGGAECLSPQVLATGLSALYSSLPRKIEVRGDDWHFLRREDWIGVSSLVLFMNSLEFCNAVIQVRLAGCWPCVGLAAALTPTLLRRLPTPSCRSSWWTTSTTGSLFLSWGRRCTR